MQNDGHQIVHQADVSTLCPGSLKGDKRTCVELRMKGTTNGDVPAFCSLETRVTLGSLT